jgi:hypothetical protein
MRSRARLRLVLPSLFGLAPCGVYPAPGVTAGAVRSYRTISPLPRRWRFRNGERTRQAGSTRVLQFQGCPPERGVAEAVCFLWHWPSVSLDAHVPDVIRHTALRSSDFPPPADKRRTECEPCFTWRGGNNCISPKACKNTPHRPRCSNGKRRQPSPKRQYPRPAG